MLTSGGGRETPGDHTSRQEAPYGLALTSIVMMAVPSIRGSSAHTIIHDTQQQPGWSNLSFDPPWLTLAIVYVLVYAVALGTSYLPALRASRIYPAEALRYQ
jgi:ABC-type lipoprotein release transport system permease subunit